ncbi:PREDICTED: transcription termination factor 3, mitochondrial-like [Branchiostoma belcheri]|uniref:Transcription termination factor 3, mitochondrial n=1 Tax=Branchiostoma belcheri TaxID=7741 RepID=A0A6P4Y4F4_BRABE|nr:PREDICTED: transcription termination factor 3, mitochondrial-like [Branchiostoma belcheri]XP_019613566.1 PREDICTED: transcription termination factor 3, mitochondrial-like [Branchiostoma belcheri]XP_019613567.1 PREDICTED: transcription termination factor 3, mitochondrial-like [Branchiostoma belcheri]
MKSIVRTAVSAALIQSARNHLLPTVSAYTTSKCTVTCVQYSNYTGNHCTPMLRTWTSGSTVLLAYVRQRPRSNNVRLPAGITSTRSMIASYCPGRYEANSSSLHANFGTDRPEQHQDIMPVTEVDEESESGRQTTTGTSERHYINCSNENELGCSTNLTSTSKPVLSPSTSETERYGDQKTNDSSVNPPSDQSSLDVAVLEFVDFPEGQKTGSDLELADLDNTDVPSVDRQQAYRGPVHQHAYVGLRTLVDHSETLQKLVHLGVDLHKVSRKRNAANLIAKLDFDSQVKEKLMFLLDVGVTKENLGSIISVNPFILGVELDRLEKRVQYLMSKKFKEDEIAGLVSRAPHLLQLSVQRLDNKLGWLQGNLQTTAAQTRHIVVRYPRVLTVSLARMKENLQVAQLQLGFSPEQLRTMVLRAPRMLSRDKYKLIAVFDYLHNEMGIPHHILACSPQVFNSRKQHLSARHQFLQKLGRAQYDPAQPGYICLENFFKLPDAVFCTQLAKVTMEEYQNFLKTL